MEEVTSSVAFEAVSTEPEPGFPIHRGRRKVRVRKSRSKETCQRQDALANGFRDVVRELAVAPQAVAGEVESAHAAADASRVCPRRRPRSGAPLSATAVPPREPVERVVRDDQRPRPGRAKAARLRRRHHPRRDVGHHRRWGLHVPNLGIDHVLDRLVDVEARPVQSLLEDFGRDRVAKDRMQVVERRHGVRADAAESRRAAELVRKVDRRHLARGRPR